MIIFFNSLFELQIESKCPNTESASTSEKKEDRLPPLTNSLHDACALCADVVKAMVWSSDEEWTSNHQDSSLVKSRASSVQVSNPIFADNYSRSSSGGKPVFYMKIRHHRSRLKPMSNWFLLILH